MVASSPCVTRDPVEMLKLARTITSFFLRGVCWACAFSLGTSSSCREVYECPRGEIALSSKRKKEDFMNFYVKYFDRLESLESALSAVY